MTSTPRPRRSVELRSPSSIDRRFPCFSLLSVVTDGQETTEREPPRCTGRTLRLSAPSHRVHVGAQCRAFFSRFLRIREALGKDIAQLVEPLPDPGKVVFYRLLENR